MKRVIFLLSLNAFSLISCRPDSSNPVDTVKNYLKALKTFDFEMARTLVMPDCLDYIGRFEKAAARMSKEEGSNAVELASIDRFTYDFVAKTDSTVTISVNKPGESKDRGILFSLKKRNDRWLVYCLK